MSVTSSAPRKWPSGVLFGDWRPWAILKKRKEKPMERSKSGKAPQPQPKQIVVVFDSEACITDIIREIVLPRRTPTDIAASISAIGFVDGSQISEIVKILDNPKMLPQ